MRVRESPPGRRAEGRGTGRVIVAHGLFLIPFQFAVVRKALWRAGFEVSFVRYASNRQPAAESVREVGAFLDRMRPAAASAGEDGGGPVHFIGYSLGALVLRSALAARPGFPAGRFVMIAPPNGGVGLLSGPLPAVALRCGGPALNDLREGSDFVRTLPPPRPGAGIIAGDRPATVLHPSWWLRRRIDAADPHDGTVELRNTRLVGVPHVTVRRSHATICWSPAVAGLVRTFLESGRFPAASDAA